MSNTELLTAWLGWLSMTKGRSDQTCDKYRGYLNLLVDFVEGQPLLQVDLQQLEDFTGRHLFEQQMSVRSRVVAIAAIRNFYRWAKKSGASAVDQAHNLEYPSFGRRLPRMITLQDAEKMLNAPDLSTFLGIRDAAIMAMLIGCGLRISGLCSLNDSSLIWVQDDHGRQRLVVRVIEKGKKERMVPAPTEALLLVRAYLGHADLDGIDRYLSDGDQVLFVTTNNQRCPKHKYHGENRRIAARTINDMLAKYARRAGVDVAFAHPHAFRHLYGTEAVESDLNMLTVQQLLGHERSDTTKIYVHLAMRKLVADVDRANPLGKMRTPVSELAKHVNS